MSSPREAPDGVAHDPETRHRRRQVYYGWGTRASVEKNVYGRFLHDSFTALGEVAVLGLPALLWVVLSAPTSEYFGVKNAALFALPTMVVVVAGVRGRLLAPPFADAEGWLTSTPFTVVFRFVYYNLALVVVCSLGGFLGAVVGLGAWSVVVTVGLAAGVVAVLPWAAGQSENRLTG